MNNLRAEINFVEIKPTTKIIKLKYNYELYIANHKLIIYNDHPEFKTDISIYLWNFYNPTTKQFLMDKQTVLCVNNNFVNYHSKPEYTKIMTTDSEFSEFNKFTNFNTNIDVYWELLLYVKKTFFTSSGELINIQFKSALDYYLGNTFISTIKIVSLNDLYIFVDETKKPNNRKIKLYKTIEEFEKSREQFKSYHLLDMYYRGYPLLIEEMP